MMDGLAVQDGTGRVYRLIDLFSGAGGMSLGFSTAFGHPFHSVWANDFNPHCITTYQANFPGSHCYPGDLLEVLKEKQVRIPQADVVIGGPPCQGFSLLNKNRHHDPRRAMWRLFFDVVDRCHARVFVMENVPQLIGSLEYQAILSYADSLGFQVCSKVLIAADYGVPQVRRRAFIVGSRDCDPALFFPPPASHVKPDSVSGKRHLNQKETGPGMQVLQNWRTVRDAIGDLPIPDSDRIGIESPMDLHFRRNPTPLSRARYRAIPEEGMNRFDLQRRAFDLTPACWIRKKTGGTDLFGRLWWNRPAFTIRTEFFKPEKGRYLHPEQHRPLTHREAARLQSFPDDFKFTGSKSEIARQIGNAVPPLLAAGIAGSIVRLLDSVKKSH